MQCCIFFLKVNITSYIYVSQDWVLIHHNLAQSISSVTEKEVVTSGASLKQPSNRCSRKGRNLAMEHGPPGSLCILSKKSWKEIQMDWRANGLQVVREEKPCHTTAIVTTTDNLPSWASFGSHVTLTSYNPWNLPPSHVVLCPYLVFGTVRTTQLN